MAIITIFRAQGVGEGGLLGEWRSEGPGPGRAEHGPGKEDCEYRLFL